MEIRCKGGRGSMVFASIKRQSDTSRCVVKVVHLLVDKVVLHVDAPPCGMR